MSDYISLSKEEIIEMYEDSEKEIEYLQDRVEELENEVEEIEKGISSELDEAYQQVPQELADGLYKFANPGTAISCRYAEDERPKRKRPPVQGSML